MHPYVFVLHKRYIGAYGGIQHDFMHTMYFVM